MNIYYKHNDYEYLLNFPYELLIIYLKNDTLWKLFLETLTTALYNCKHNIKYKLTFLKYYVHFVFIN